MIRQIVALWVLVFRRLCYEPGLTLALLIGWLAAVALVAAIPMYSDAVNQRLLRNELQNEPTSRRTAFGLFFHFTDSPTAKRNATEERLQWERYGAVNQYLGNQSAIELGLNQEDFLHYAKSDLFQLFPHSTDLYRQRTEALARINLAFISALEENVLVTEGRFPSVEWSPGEALEVLVSPQLANELGLQVDEGYQLFVPPSIRESNTREAFSAPVKIVGIWQAAEADAPRWYTAPSSFSSSLLVPQTLYTTRLADQIPRLLFDVGWYQQLDGSAVRAEDVAPFLHRMGSVESTIDSLLPGTRLSLSPEAALRRYQRTVSTQALLLLLLAIPVIGLILLFIGLIARSAVERQQLEISIMKSRGSSSAQIMTLFGFQGATLALGALLFGLPLGRLMAQGMGAVRQFMVFGQGVSLSVAVTRESILYALCALAVVLCITAFPAYRAAQLTIVAAKNLTARSPVGRWGWTLGTDALILAAAGYGYYLLDQQGRFANMVWGKGVDPWENPLLFVAPSLALLASTRLIVNLFPISLLILERLASILPGTVMLLAIRNLGRNSQQYSALWTLLILTAGLGVFITSLARTLDDNLVARNYYQVGAQVALVEAAGRSAAGVNAADSGSSSQSALGESGGNPLGATWSMLPVEEHLRAPGIRAAARVGIFPGNVRQNTRSTSVQVYGIDRIDFPKVAYFRRDFANLSLGQLMNALAMDESGILVPRAFLEDSGYSLGDSIELRGLIPQSSQSVLFTIVGQFDLFPTAFPHEDASFVANLDYIFTQLGGPIPYYVWLSVAENVEREALRTELESIGFRILKMEDVRENIESEQTQPARMGLFGFLSLGFIVTMMLSLLALGVHTFLMYQRRFIQFGILRAIGLSARQMAVSLAGEQFATTAFGILGGLILGLAVSFLFIPYMQMGYAETDLIPPFVTIVAWREVTIVVTLLLIASFIITVGLTWILSRLRIFQAIKLGETMG
ncbi:MAG: FtsX-like permease family protein [Chloroflexota bacterium]